VSFIFAGTPDFAATVLRELVRSGRRPTLVVSLPDRPRGRGLKTCCPPVVVEAARLEIEAVQVDDLNAPDTVAVLAATGAKKLVVAAFGQLLREVVLERFLCLNVHPSLLPAYRGAAPIERALAAGEERTGVSIMRMTAGLDEGPWAIQKEISIGLHDDAGSLGRSLALLGAVSIDQVLTGLTDGTISWTEQRGPSSYARKLDAHDCALRVGLGARAVHDGVRALSPDIGVRTHSGTVKFKVWRTWPYGQAGLDPVPDQALGLAGSPGRLLCAGGRLYLGCAEGVVELLLVQPVGKARMTAAEFLRGYKARLGEAVEMPA
jgi:methionyl-tRNA formyltransferase